VRLLMWSGLVMFAATCALAQRGGPGFGGGRIGVAPNPRMPPAPIPWVGPIPPLGPTAPGFPGGGNRSVLRPGATFFGPYIPSVGYPSGGYPVSPSTQNVIVLQSVPETPPPPPPKPAKLMIWEAPGQAAPEAPVASEPRAFAIALKDGTTISAAAVWAQDNLAHYIDAEGAHKRVPLSAIDREVTLRLNRARNLVLRLPPSE